MREFLDMKLGLFHQARSQLVDRAEHDALVASSDSREAAWTAYAAEAESRIGDAAPIVEASSEAWLAEQHKFREIAASVRALEDTLSAKQAASTTPQKLSGALVRLRRARHLVRETLTPNRPSR